MLLLIRRLLLVFLLQPVLDCLPVGLGVGIGRIEFQRIVVSGDRLPILALAGQRIAEVVGGVATGRLSQRLRRGGVVASAIRRRATPRRVARQLLCLFCLALFQRLRRLLVGTLPQVGPCRCHSRRRQHRQYDQRQQQQPAATERQRDDQQ